VLWVPVINRCVKTEQSILKISIFLCSVGYVVELACYGEVDMHLGTKLMFSESSKFFGSEHSCKCLYLLNGSLVAYELSCCNWGMLTSV
jgi:hypothetical protein